jgi:hypothetical protein
VDDEWIPLFAIFCVFGLPISGWIIARVLKHRERIEMIRAGMVPPASRRAGPERWAGPAAVPPSAVYSVEAAQVSLRKGITLACIGTALFIGLSFIGYHDGEIHPGPWLLGGLIPLFIGVAQILIAVLSGAALTQRQFGPPGGPVPPAETPAAPGPGPQFDGPYTYRPGSTPELERPNAPPERR